MAIEKRPSHGFCNFVSFVDSPDFCQPSNAFQTKLCTPTYLYLFLIFYRFLYIVLKQMEKEKIQKRNKRKELPLLIVGIDLEGVSKVH